MDEIRTVTDGNNISATDSVTREPYQLYCGYFSRPVHITDSSFFVAAISARGGHKIPLYYVNPQVVTTYYSYTNREWGSGYVFCMPILPIIAPPPGETPDSGSDNAVRTFDGVVSHDISVSPNPAQGEFSVKSDGCVLQVELYDSKGALCRRWGGCQGRYSLYGINTGVYAIKIRTRDGVATKKLIVRK